MEVKKYIAYPSSPRRELIRRIRQLSPDKIEILLQAARNLESESKKNMEELENDIKTGAYKNWTTSEYKLWDPDYVKLTPDEAIELEKSNKEFEKGAFTEWKPGMFTES